jgi:hypothetical protein
MSAIESITIKIQKLLALADGNANEHEREMAMKFAMDLLAKHNLSMSEVQSSTFDVEIQEIFVQLRLDPWVRFILTAACKLYYTDFMMRPVYKNYNRKEYHPVLIGTEENVKVTIEMASWLMNSVRIESNWLFDEAYERRSFRLGASHKIYERALTFIQEEKDQNAGTVTGTGAGNTTGTSLMVIRNKLEKANAEHIAKQSSGTFKGRGSSAAPEAYDMGQAYGDSVNLGKTPKSRALTMR